jgi:hypothetical protein
MGFSETNMMRYIQRLANKLSTRVDTAASHLVQVLGSSWGEAVIPLVQLCCSAICMIPVTLLLDQLHSC